MYSALNKLSEYIYFTYQKTLLHALLLPIFKIFESSYNGHKGSICLDTWINAVSDLKTKKSFVSYHSVTWIMTRCILSNNRIVTIIYRILNHLTDHLDHLFFIYFLSQSVFPIFPENLCQWNSRANTRKKNPKPITT